MRHREPTPPRRFLWSILERGIAAATLRFLRCVRPYATHTSPPLIPYQSRNVPARGQDRLDYTHSTDEETEVLGARDFFRGKVSSLRSSALPTYLIPLLLSQGSSETSLPPLCADASTPQSLLLEWEAPSPYLPRWICP